MARPRRLVPRTARPGTAGTWLLGVAGLRGPRALEELAVLLISTGELTTKDLRRLPRQSGLTGLTH